MTTKHRIEVLEEQLAHAQAADEKWCLIQAGPYPVEDAIAEEAATRQAIALHRQSCKSCNYVLIGLVSPVTREVA